jgi:Fe-S cluster assembly protein SufD
MLDKMVSKKELSAQLEKFELFEKETAQPSWLAPLRKAGMARFAAAGFPTLQQEDWRFTNVSPIAKLPFRPVFQSGTSTLSQDQLSAFPFAKLPGTRLVFLNGHYQPSLSVVAADGAEVHSLAAGLAANEAALRQHLSSSSVGEDNSFSALNSAFFQDGAFIHIKAGRKVAQPIQLLFVSTLVESGSTSHPRNVILAEANSQASILESYVSIADAPYFTNAVTEFVLGEGAVVEHVKFQDEAPSAFHIAAIRAHLARGANLASHSIALGARLSRNNIRTVLAGEGVECVLNGLYLTRGEQLADHHMVVDHSQPNCNSHEYFNGILDNRSKGVFHGRILVRQAAQKTDAKQTNKNLLLSDEATVDTKPQLEIYADDVKCTHGATVGQLNEESIFYLRARGIGAERARRMLIHSFAGEIIQRIRTASIREELNGLAWDRLEANPLVADAPRG